MPSEVEVEPAGLLVEQAQHDALAVARRGCVETRTSTARPAMRRLMRPSCGRRFSAMSSFAMTLMRETTSGATARLVCSTSRSTPSTRKRTTSRFSIGLDVDVGGVLLDRLRQHRVDQPDDRRVVLALQQVGRLRQVLRELREVGVVLDALDHLHGVATAAFVGLAQQLVEAVVGHALDHQRHAEEAAQLRRRLEGCAPAR